MYAALEAQDRMKFSFSLFVYCFKTVDIKAGKLQNTQLITERAMETPKSMG